MNKVKIIKLNRRYKLYKEQGFTHAIKFDSWESEVWKVETFFRERYGSEYAYKQSNMWRTHWGKPGKHTPRPFMIGVRDEEMIFVAQLAGVI
jgi:hypothetical protein